MNMDTYKHDLTIYYSVSIIEYTFTFDLSETYTC